MLDSGLQYFTSEQLHSHESPEGQLNLASFWLLGTVYNNSFERKKKSNTEEKIKHITFHTKMVLIHVYS